MIKGKDLIEVFILFCLFLSVLVVGEIILFKKRTGCDLHSGYLTKKGGQT